MTKCQKLIQALDLKPHIEGGYFKETYKSKVYFKQSDGKTRSTNTAIYYLLESGDFSMWHRLKSDEIWHYYCGGSLTLYQIDEKGNLLRTELGNPLENENFTPQYRIPADIWFAATVREPNSFVLAGCTVAPGFEYEDMETDDGSLLKAYPHLAEIIKQFMREVV